MKTLKTYKQLFEAKYLPNGFIFSGQKLKELPKDRQLKIKEFNL